VFVSFNYAMRTWPHDSTRGVLHISIFKSSGGVACEALAHLIAKTSSKVKRFEDINFQTNLGVRVGYSREIITDILNRDSMSPRIIEYESDQDAKNLFKTGEIDVLCMIDQQPSRFSQEISNSYGVNFIKVPNRESILTTDMNLIRYKTNIISTTLHYNDETTLHYNPPYHLSGGVLLGTVLEFYLYETTVAGQGQADQASHTLSEGRVA